MGQIYKDFYNHLVQDKHSIGLNMPLEVEIALTDICNQKCSHCSNAQRINSDKVFFNIDNLSSILSCNPLIITLTGGEPLLHPKFIEIVRKIKEVGIFIRVLTNGVLLSSTTIDALYAAGWNNEDIIQVSLDAIDRNTYIDQRGVDNCEDAIERIKLLVEKGVTVDVHTVPTKYNINQILSIYQKVNSIGVTYFSGGPLAPFNIETLSIMCSIDEMENIHEQIMQESKTQYTKYLGGLNGEICSNYKKLETIRSENYPQPDRYKCAAGRFSCYINEKSDVFPCVYLLGAMHYCGNLNEASLAEIWINKETFTYKHGFSVSGTPCGSCEFWGFCNGGCIGLSTIYSDKIVPGHDPRCFRNLPLT